MADFLSDEQMGQLINLYHEEENLYNYRYREYHDRDSARESLLRISSAMGRTGTEPTETSQQFSQNMNEDIEEESTVGELIVLPGLSHKNDSGNMHNSSQSLNPQSSTDRTHTSPNKAPEEESRTILLLESIAKRGTTVNEKFCNDDATQLEEMPREKKRAARNRIQAILSEFNEDESDHE